MANVRTFVQASEESFSAGSERVLERLACGEFGSLIDFELRTFAEKISLQEGRLGGGVNSLFSTRASLMPHQVRVAHWALHNPFTKGVILADEVGLGKTIEAAIITKELICRGRARRILILIPAKLTSQWRHELLEKINEDFLVLNSSEARRAGAAGLNPWASNNRVIASLDYARAKGEEGRRARMEQINAQPWDVLIVDEAHALKDPGSGNHDFIRGIAREHTLFLTGTPIRNHAWDLFHVSNIIERREEKPLGTKYSFRKTFLQDGRGLRVKNVPELIERVEKFLIRNTKSKVPEIRQVKRIGRTFHFEMLGPEREFHAKAKLAEVKALIPQVEAEREATADGNEKERLSARVERLRGQVQWVESTIIEIIISEAQNEVRDFGKWGFEIIPHRVVMKTGFQTPDGKRVATEDAFKDPQHPFRIAIICAMWLTGFDVECLSTLYIDKPMKAHTLMQAIARANRVYPGKDCGVIVDYNGMLRSLREALAQYALGDDGDGSDSDIVAPITELVKALLEAIEAGENHLKRLGFDPVRLVGTKGFDRIQALRDAVDALYTSDEAKRRFEITARQVFIRFKALLMEPSALAFAERHDNIEAIYKKLEEKRDTADVTEVLKELHKIVNQAIRAQQPGEDHAEGLTVDLSRIDFAKLRDEFARRVKRKHAALRDIRDVIETKLQQMLARNPMRMDYYKRYQEIIADYNREKDRATVEETFAKLVDLANSLDAEQRRAAEEGLNDDEYALFQMLFKENLSKADREKLKQVSKSLLASLRDLVGPMPEWTKNTTTQAEVKVFILDNLWQGLPRPPFTDEDTESLADRVYDYVWQRSASGDRFESPAAV